MTIETPINEILPFAQDGIVDAGDLLSLDDYEKHPMRLRGHLPGIAERALQNMANRQSAHMAAGSAQFLANRYEAGVKDDGDLDKIEKAWLSVITAMIKAEMPAAYDISQTLDYFLCWRIFKSISPVIQPGMVPVNGTLIADAKEKYPKAFEYLLSPAGQTMCIDEESWQEASVSIWHTLADGEEIGWEKVGGVCKYVIDPDANTIRVPDLRGMYAEVAGFDGLGVGEVHGDGVRSFKGGTFQILSATNIHQPDIGATGIFSVSPSSGYGASGSHYQYADLQLNSDNVLPPASRTQIASWASSSWVWLGFT